MQPGDVLDGRFELLAQAGAGGMGKVFRARDRVTDELVAVKLLHPGVAATSELRSRLLREARTLAEFRHPGVIRYVYHGQDTSGAPYLVMEWLAGEDLGARLARGPLAIEEAITVAARAAEALGAMHACGIIHRDLKPSNLFLPGSDLQQIKLIDFGLVRLSEGTLITRSGSLMGTPSYMAPEQVRDVQEIDARADVFALGCVLYECLTGVQVFTGAHPMAVLAKVLLAEVPLPSSLRPEVPEALDALCARMLAKAPDERPCDGAAVAAAIEALRMSVSRLDTPTSRAGDPSTYALTSEARRVLTLVLMSPAPTRGETAARQEAATSTRLEPHSLREALENALGVHNGEIERLADGSIVVTLMGGLATDQAAQASRCALALVDHAPGRLVAVVTGRGEMTERLPAGELIDRAVRMLQQPPPRPGVPGDPPRISIDEVTAGLLDARFEVLDTGSSLWLKSEQPLAREARLLMGNPTACVGRDWELSALEGILASCVEESQARAVLITAQAGLGKTRLAYELLRRIRQRGAPVAVWIGRGDPLRTGAALGPLGHIVQAACSLRAGEAIEMRRERILGRMQALAKPGEVRRIAEFLGEIVGAPFPEEESVLLRAARRDTQLMADQTRRAWVDFLDAACAAHPVLLVLEDLHWVDRPTVQFVEEALRQLSDRPWMALALARPEVHHAFPGLWAERQPQEIRLKPLSSRASARLVRQVLGAQIDSGTVDRLVAQADGNAFFLEELLRAAAAGKGDAPPETVLAMVQSRLEALDEAPRRILRAASVLGGAFWPGAVQAMLGDALSERTLDEGFEQLERQEWITSRSEPRFEGEREFVFRHALVREAAYGMLTDEGRAIAHCRAGAWLERLGETSAGVIAEHYDRGRDAPRAVEAYRRAAAEALAANDLVAVLARSEHALALGAQGEVRGELLRLRAEAHHWRGEYAESGSSARLAMEVLPRGNDAWYAAGQWAGMACSSLMQHADLATLADELADAWIDEVVGSHAVAAMARMAIAMRFAGLYDRAELLHSRIEAVADRFQEDPIVCGTVSYVRGGHELFAGHLGAGHALLRRAVWHYERAGDRRLLCWSRIILGYSLCQLGAYAEATELLRVALTDSERIGGWLVPFALHNLGLALLGLGALEEARVAEAKAVPLSVEQGDILIEGWSRIYLATILLRAGDLETAEAEARSATKLVGDTSPYQASARAALGEALLAQGRVEEAFDEARAAMALLDMLGKVEEGEAQIRLVCAKALAATGDHAAARAAISEARSRLLAAANRIDDRALRESFLRNVPEHALTLALARAWTGEEAVGKPPVEPA